MTRFKDELERQLLDAARARERSPWRWLRRAHAPARALLPPAALAGAVALLVVLVVVGRPADEREIEPAQRVPTAERPYGQYVAGKIRLLLVPNGYELRGPELYLFGTLSERGGKLIFVRPPGGGRLPRGMTRAERDDCLLPRADGTYGWSLSGLRLRLRAVDDPCGPRRAALDGRDFTRIGD